MLTFLSLSQCGWRRLERAPGQSAEPVDLAALDGERGCRWCRDSRSTSLILAPNTLLVEQRKDVGIGAGALAAEGCIGVTQHVAAGLHRRGRARSTQRLTSFGDAAEPGELGAVELRALSASSGAMRDGCATNVPMTVPSFGRRGIEEAAPPAGCRRRSCSAARRWAGRGCTCRCAAPAAAP